MNFVGSGTIASETLSKDGVSTISSMTRPNPESMQTPAFGNQWKNDGKPRGLNARMRKRLIEREVELRGKEAGLSMEAILMASKSIKGDEPVVKHKTGQTRSIPSGRDGAIASMETPNSKDMYFDTQGNSHLLKNHTDSWRAQPNHESLHTRFNSWFGRVDSHHTKHQDDMTNDGRSAITFDSAPFYSPYQSRQEGRSITREKMSILSNADVIPVAQDEECRQSPTNWNEWDCPAAVKTPVLPKAPAPPLYGEVEVAVYQQGAGQSNEAAKPAKFFSPNLRKAAQGVARRLRGQNKGSVAAALPINHADVDDIDDLGYDNTITILDERDDMENKNVPERTSDFEYYYANSSERGSGRKRRIHRLMASSPHWVSEGPDRATGFMHIARDGDSITAASVELSLESFHAGLQQNPPLPPSHLKHHSNTNSTGEEVKRPVQRAGMIHANNTSTFPDDASSAWKRPGRIATDFQGSTPLSRRLPRQDPDESSSLAHQEATQEKDPQQLSAPYTASRSIRSELNLPPSGVRLIKKNSSLSKIRPPPRAVASHRSRSNSSKHVGRKDVYATSYGRIGAAPMMVGDAGATLVEMNVESNENAMILGSIDEDHGGMELEWGHSI
jgi:hypothetical protein